MFLVVSVRVEHSVLRFDPLSRRKKRDKQMAKQIDQQFTLRHHLGKRETLAGLQSTVLKQIQAPTSTKHPFKAKRDGTFEWSVTRSTR